MHLHHDYFGYTSIHAIAILAPFLFVSRPLWVRLSCIVVIFLSSLSTILAASRAGMAFVLLTTLVTVTVSLWISVEVHLRRRVFAGGVFCLLAFSLVLGAISYKNDPVRWGRLKERIEEGFHGDALQIVGEGPVVHGDTARPIVARAAWKLAQRHPWGIDGSRQGYELAVRQLYPNPVNDLNHSHNGWLDTCLEEHN
jgi:hypothetical protein